MKKIVGLILVMVSAFALVACSDGYSVEENYVILDVTDLTVEEKKVGKVTDYYLVFKNSKGKEQKIEMRENLGTKVKEELKVLEKAKKITGENKTIKYDIFVDGKTVEGISLSRKRM